MTRTIYFCGGEDSDFTSVGTTSIDTTSGHYRSSFARCGLKAPDGDSGWTPDSSNLGNFTSAWFHARVWMNGTSVVASSLVSATERTVVKFFDAIGGLRLAIYNTATSGGAINPSDPGNWRFATVNAAGTFTNIGAVFNAFFSASPSTPDSFDVQISNYATSNGGSVNIWINGTLAFSVSGVTLATDSNTTINNWRLCGCHPGANGPIPFTYSEVIVSDTDTRNLSLATLTPAADGNTVNWDTGDVSNVNETTLNDITLNASGTAGQVQQYTIGSLPSGSFGVIGLGINARAQQGSAGGPTKLDFGYRTGSTDYWDTDISLPVALGRVSTVLYTNANTGAAFTTGDLNTVGFNVGLKSVT